MAGRFHPDKNIAGLRREPLQEQPESLEACAADRGR
jgi:hypothetical protein